LTVSGAISGSGYGLSNTGAGTTILSSPTGNSYTGGTTVSSGIVYVNSGVSGTSSGTGSGAVAVTSGGTLAGSGSITTSSGVSVTSGGTLGSGSAQSGTSVNGTHLNINNTQVSLSGTSGSGHAASLSFSLGAGTNGLVSNPSGGAYNFNNPDTDTTYVTLTGSAKLNFALNSVESVTLNDLTTSATLSLRQGTPYLLVQAGSDSDYTNLITVSGGGAAAVYSIDGTGYVVGVLTSAGLADENFLGAGNAHNLSLADYNAITIDQVGPIGPLTGTAVYPDAVLYLNGGDLEVVPEPGTWALMIGGLAALVFWQRRRSE
jgi:hypothetical protein